MKYDSNKQLSLWATAKFQPGSLAKAKTTVTRLVKNKARYLAVEKATGVPWWVVLIIHEREASGDFSTYLGNGDPLGKPTRHVPAGRGPFATWEAGAIDALRYEGFHKITDWSIPHALYLFEVFNGPGYANRGLPSPYVWAGSSVYKKGKFEVDHGFNPEAVDTQLGAATMLQALLSLGLLGNLKANSNVTVGTTPTLANLLGVAVGAAFTALGVAGFGADTFHTIASIAGIVGMGAAAVNQLHLTGSSDNNTANLIAHLAGQVRDQAEAAAAAKSTDGAPTA